MLNYIFIYILIVFSTVSEDFVRAAGREHEKKSSVCMEPLCHFPERVNGRISFLKASHRVRSWRFLFFLPVRYLPCTKQITELLNLAWHFFFNILTFSKVLHNTFKRFRAIISCVYSERQPQGSTVFIKKLPPLALISSKKNYTRVLQKPLQ